MHKDREHWIDDVRASQRNIVFPDTAQNEARFWRNAMSGRSRLTKAQIAGFALMALTVGTILFIAVSDDLKYVCTTGSLAARSFCVLVNRAPLLALLGLLFLLLRWMVRRALAEAEQSKKSDHMKWKC